MERLRGRKRFQTVFKEGRSVSNRALALFVLQGKAGAKHFAVAAGRRLGKAHVRNRARRLLREAVRKMEEHFPDGYDVILLARAGILGMKVQDVQKALAEAMEKAGMSEGGGKIL